MATIVVVGGTGYTGSTAPSRTKNGIWSGTTFTNCSPAPGWPVQK